MPAEERKSYGRLTIVLYSETVRRCSYCHDEIPIGMRMIETDVGPFCSQKHAEDWSRRRSGSFRKK